MIEDKVKFKGGTDCMLKVRKNVISKISVCLLVLVILANLGINVVLGNDSGGSSGENSGGGGDSQKCSDCSCSYDNAPSYGVRLSLVKWETGERIPGTKSVDVFSSLEATSRIKQFRNVYILPGDNSSKYNRVDMLNQIKDFTSNPSLNTTTWGDIPKVSSDTLEWNGSAIIV